MAIKTCVAESGRFTYGIHKPEFVVKNHRESDRKDVLGKTKEGDWIFNEINFPDGDVIERKADWIFEIPNAFPFRGTTYIARSWADEKAADPAKISLPRPENLSLNQSVKAWLGDDELPVGGIRGLFKGLPDPILFATASVSTDPDDLIALANCCCDFLRDSDGRPVGLAYCKDAEGKSRALIRKHQLFEVLVNNPFLPDNYKEIMVLRPGAQGGSEIVGEYLDAAKESHVYEYLRRNSYIPWGHYAANMSEDAIRYSLNDLSLSDLTGLRHLYYQRTYTRLAEEMGVSTGNCRHTIPVQTLEETRLKLLSKLTNATDPPTLSFNRSLWGWNYGYDFAPSEYRMHASHQQIHQQYAMIPRKLEMAHGQEAGEFIPFACGDLIESFTSEFTQKTGQDFFDTYIKAIDTNSRIDEDPDRESSLVVYSTAEVMVFVPKAQVSQWELQLMTLNPVGNILEADTITRQAIDQAILVAMKTLTALGARMITSIEFSKRFDSEDRDQRYLISFLPKLPESPGAFSEAQLRWINGHYPEDFAIACRAHVPDILNSIGETKPT